MEALQVCYEYAGIQAIIPTSSADWASWVGAIGTLAAAWLAVSLYSRAKRDAKADERARRRVLIAVIRQYVVRAADFIKSAHEWLEDPEVHFDEASLRDVMATLEMSNVDRLVEMQARLLDFGEEGDAALAVFAETCRQYQSTHARWKSIASKKSFWDTSGQNDPLPVNAMRYELSRIRATVQPALDALDRFEK